MQMRISKFLLLVCLSLHKIHKFSLLPSDVPLIHYDPVIDGHNQGSTASSFLSVLAPKALYKQHKAEHDRVLTIPVRFTVMAIDKMTTLQAAEISKIDSLCCVQHSFVYFRLVLEQ